MGLADGAAGSIRVSEERAISDIPETLSPRQRERSEEEARYPQVIVRRHAEAKRDPDDILQFAIEEGLIQAQRAPVSLGLSAIGAGLIVGFSAMAVGIVSALVASGELPVPLRLAQAVVYPLGFVFCVVSGTELFTEHTATSLYPALDGHVPFSRVLRVWGLVFLGNLVGAAVSAGLLALADPVIGASAGYEVIGHHLTDPAAPALFMSAVMAGWLMALGAWLILATPPGVAEVMLIYMVTALIGLGGLHHSIAGSVEAFVAFLVTDTMGALDVLRFVTIAALGNLVGGSVFVALLNYGHIRPTQSRAPDVG
jgi:formate/nitrite transporter FocA (FNT family)